MLYTRIQGLFFTGMWRHSEEWWSLKKVSCLGQACVLCVPFLFIYLFFLVGVCLLLVFRYHLAWWIPVLWWGFLGATKWSKYSETVKADGLDESCWEQRRHQQHGEISLIIPCWHVAFSLFSCFASLKRSEGFWAGLQWNTWSYSILWDSACRKSILSKLSWPSFQSHSSFQEWPFSSCEENQWNLFTVAKSVVW